MYILPSKTAPNKQKNKLTAECVCVLVTQSCLTLCDTIDCSPPASSVDGILQARILENPFLQGIFLTQGLNPCLLL